MEIREHVPLSQFSTMRLGGKARYLAEVTSDDELVEALEFAKTHSIPSVIIGTGANIVWTDEGYPGLVIVNRIDHCETLEDELQYSILRFGSGLIWDKAVVQTIELGLTGIESLSLIPGTCGAAPVQNIGAYGQELADTLVAVHAYDREIDAFLTLDKAGCGFGYRTSIFNKAQKGRYIITGISLKLFKSKPQPPFYKDVEAYLSEHDIFGPTPAQLREAVIAIRTIKLPDPGTVANNGSFFRNPVVERESAQKLLAAFPDLPSWEMNDGKFKLSAAWMIEHAGFPKDTHDQATGMATWKNQALVLVNEHARSSADLMNFRNRIIAAVQDKFQISLVQEPEIIT